MGQLLARELNHVGGIEKMMKHIDMLQARICSVLGCGTVGVEHKKENVFVYEVLPCYVAVKIKDRLLFWGCFEDFCTWIESDGLS